MRQTRVQERQRQNYRIKQRQTVGGRLESFGGFSKGIFFRVRCNLQDQRPREGLERVPPEFVLGAMLGKLSESLGKSDSRFICMMRYLLHLKAATKKARTVYTLSSQNGRFMSLNHETCFGP